MSSKIGRSAGTVERKSWRADRTVAPPGGSVWPCARGRCWWIPMVGWCRDAESAHRLGARCFGNILQMRFDLASNCLRWWSARSGALVFFVVVGRVGAPGHAAPRWFVHPCELYLTWQESPACIVKRLLDAAARPGLHVIKCEYSRALSDERSERATRPESRDAYHRALPSHAPHNLPLPNRETILIRAASRPLFLF